MLKISAMADFIGLTQVLPSVMMDTSTLAVIIASLALAMNLIVHFLNGGWRLSTTLADMENRLRSAIAESKSEIEARQERLSREFGETVAALKQKIHDVELWTANNFTRRESVNSLRVELVNDIKDVSKKIDMLIERAANEDR